MTRFTVQRVTSSHSFIHSLVYPRGSFSPVYHSAMSVLVRVFFFFFFFFFFYLGKGIGMKICDKHPFI